MYNIIRSEVELFMRMKKIAVGLLMAAVMTGILFSVPSYTEDRDTILLARTIYALGRTESYETKLALGTVVMNRVENAWFADTLSGVLAEQQQFPAGEKYDEESLKAAHAVLTGTRTISASALYYQATDAAQPRTDKPIAVIGGYAFYDSTDRI